MTNDALEPPGVGRVGLERVQERVVDHVQVLAVRQLLQPFHLEDIEFADLFILEILHLGKLATILPRPDPGSIQTDFEDAF